MEKIVRGYVIQLTPYKENDCIVTIMVEDSGELLSFSARGIMKITSKNCPSCQLYTKGEYLINYKIDNSNTNTLKSGIIIDYLPDIYSKIEVNMILGLLAEGIKYLQDSLTDSERIELFSVVYESLKTLKNYSTIILVILKYFMIYSGIIMEADCCVCCGNKEHIVDVSYQEGGYICYQCNHKIDPHRSAAYLRNYRYVIKADIKNIYDFAVADEIAPTLIADFFEYLESAGGLKLKSRSVITNMIK